jgi:hypothetical protein
MSATPERISTMGMKTSSVAYMCTGRVIYNIRLSLVVNESCYFCWCGVWSTIFFWIDLPSQFSFFLWSGRRPSSYWRRSSSSKPFKRHYLWGLGSSTTSPSWPHKIADLSSEIWPNLLHDFYVENCYNLCSHQDHNRPPRSSVERSNSWVLWTAK